MQQFAREEDDLVLLRSDRLVTSLTDVSTFFQTCIVNPQFSTFKLPGLTMEEVHKGQPSRGYAITAVVAVEVEEVPMVAGGELGLHVGDGKLRHAECPQNLRQDCLDTCQYHVPVMSQVHQDAGSAMFIVDNAAIGAGRNYFAGAEVGLTFQRKTDEFLQFLRNKKLVENDTLRR